MANSLYQWLMVGIVAALHPFFVSVIELNHNAKEKSFETSIKVFNDDFESALRKFGNTSVDLAKPADKAATDKLIAKYIAQKLLVKLDGKAIELHYLGYEQKQESTWIYFETENIASVKKVEVDCSFLYDFQDKQMNIFNVKVNGAEKNYKLDYPKTIARFDF
jgi:3',5'-cyclic AMP phosphodiesterase CpdA